MVGKSVSKLSNTDVVRSHGHLWNALPPAVRGHGQSEIDAARNGPLPSGKGLSSSSPEERGAVIDSDRWRFVRKRGQARVRQARENPLRFLAFASPR